MELSWVHVVLCFRADSMATTLTAGT